MAFSIDGRSLATNKDIDHTHFFPNVSVNLGACAADPTLESQMIDPMGHFFVDINIDTETSIGSFNVWVWGSAIAVPKVLLFCTQAYNTATTMVYRVEIGGRPFAISHESGGAVNYSYTLI